MHITLTTVVSLSIANIVFITGGLLVAMLHRKNTSRKSDLCNTTLILACTIIGITMLIIGMRDIVKYNIHENNIKTEIINIVIGGKLKWQKQLFHILEVNGGSTNIW